MARYSTTSTRKDNNGKRRKSTTIFPNIPKSTQDIFIKTTTPERLDKLADKFYNDVSLWWIIASANGVGKGTFIIPKNTSIRIPSKDEVTNILIRTNSIR